MRVMPRATPPAKTQACQRFKILARSSIHMARERSHFHAREPRPIPTSEEGMKTAADGSQVSPLAGNGAGGHAMAAVEPLEGA